MSATLPWRLDDGILLENAGLLLPWDVEFEELRRLGPPTVLNRTTSIHFAWAQATIMGGLEGTVQACRILEAPNPRAYHIYLPSFHWASFELAQIYSTVAAAECRMRTVHDAIAAATGASATSYPDYQEGLPAIMWRVGSLRIGLSPSCRYRGQREVELVGVGVKLSVAHNPAGFQELRDEAARISALEGKGSEVDYVAWSDAEHRRGNR